MNVSRRTFLGSLGAGIVGATLDPERLLWIPGQKTIFLPPPTIWLPEPGTWEEALNNACLKWKTTPEAFMASIYRLRERDVAFLGASYAAPVRATWYGDTDVITLG